jgi:cellobiose-specific phosphotransferase system component IIA
MNIGEYCPSQYIILHSQAALDNIHAITFVILPGQDHIIIIIILSELHTEMSHSCKPMNMQDFHAN